MVSLKSCQKTDSVTANRSREPSVGGWCPRQFQVFSTAAAKGQWIYHSHNCHKATLTGLSVGIFNRNFVKQQRKFPLDRLSRRNRKCAEKYGCLRFFPCTLKHYGMATRNVHSQMAEAISTHTELQRMIYQLINNKQINKCHSDHKSAGGNERLRHYGVQNCG